MKHARTLLVALALGTAPLTACGADVPDAPSARVSNASAPSTATPPSAAAETLTVDPATSHVGFVAAKITHTHEGGFREVSGSISLNATDLTQSSLRMRVATASIFADDPRLESHLKSPDFFDVATFPEATFVSTAIRAGGAGGTHTVEGDLTMHGRTKHLSFPATITVAADSVTARTEFTIDRRDFGIVYPGMPDDLIRDSVVLRIDLRAPRAAH